MTLSLVHVVHGAVSPGADAVLLNSVMDIVAVAKAGGADGTSGAVAGGSSSQGWKGADWARWAPALESGIPGDGRHVLPCRAGIVRKSGYGMLPQIE